MKQVLLCLFALLLLLTAVGCNKEAPSPEETTRETTEAATPTTEGVLPNVSEPAGTEPEATTPEATTPEITTAAPLSPSEDTPTDWNDGIHVFG